MKITGKHGRKKKLRADLEAASAEITRLKQRVFPDAPAVPAVRKDLSLISLVRKDLSLISLARKCSGGENSVPLDEFLSCIERASTIGRWDEANRLQVAILR